jgi:dTDP-4-amino-4,6-dideoxygalactose transaminase
MMKKIPFNKPYLTGKEAHYIYQAVYSGKISGNGQYTQICQDFFVEKYGFKKTLLTTSCTDALEMSAILVGIEPGDEVIVPSYTFVSTALAFYRQGAKIVFADSTRENPNIDADKLEELITPATKAIVPIHYAGIACDMDKIMELARRYNLFVIEDAAQSIESFYKGKPLGTIGHLSTFSFHETKNVNAGEGGLLGINDERFINRSEVIWEKGTNRAEFFRGEINKYGWVDIGSSFLPSDIIAAYLYAQLENLLEIQRTRVETWNHYYMGLKALEDQGKATLPYLPPGATNNAHMFYMVLRSGEERDRLIAYLKDLGINAVFHYLSLHKSPFYSGKHDGRTLENSDRYSECLIRLPMFYELSLEECQYIINAIREFKFD